MDNYETMLFDTEDALDAGAQNCLTCMHYRAKAKANICRKHPEVEDLLSEWPTIRFGIYRRTCGDWEGDK